MPDYQNLIIAGANKCGTTSLFRYLSDHPLVCGSSRKEVHFFDRNIEFSDPELGHAYLAHFPDRIESQKILLEATPNYLDGGRTVAENIRSVLNDPFIVIMLRNPIDRLISFYKSKQGWTDSPVHGMRFSDFVDQALDYRSRNCEDSGPVPAELSLQIRKSEYCAPLREFFLTFTAEKVLVVFLDSLRANPHKCLDSVCNFAGLPSNIYTQYNFHVENRSRYHRSSVLRTISSRANLMLEPLLNRLPKSRRVLRRIYDLANVTTGKSHNIDEASVAKLEDHFAPHNRELRDLLRTNGQAMQLPDWLIR
jgi:hypothetical protein